MPVPSNSRFIVVGGGIGGLVTALALTRAGHHAHVLEKAAAFEEIGAGLQLAPNASRALDKLGVLEAVTADAFFPQRLVLTDAKSGEELIALDVDEQFVERYGYRYFVTHRADMHRVIYDACLAAGVSLTAATTVVEIDDVGDGVIVTSSDGRTFEADAVIGADGLWSRIRSSYFGVDTPPIDSSYAAYRGTIPMPAFEDDLSAGLASDMVVWCGPRLHLVQYPVRRGRLQNHVATINTVTYPNDDDDLATPLRSAFQSMHPVAQRGIGDMDTAKRWNLVDREPLPTYAEGRVALVGDAAHPMLQFLAQGACQAIEDAVVLAECLSAADIIEGALSAYDAERRPRATRVQQNARRFGEIVHLDGMAAEVRNALLAQFGSHDYSLLDWLYAEGTELASGHLPVEPGTPARV